MFVAQRMIPAGIEVVDQAYDIAHHYLLRSGVIPESVSVHAGLLATIVDQFHRGERHKIKLANKAIGIVERASRGL